MRISLLHGKYRYGSGICANRPHISLQGLTPNEAATGEIVSKDKWHEHIIKAQKYRLAENRKEGQLTSNLWLSSGVASGQLSNHLEEDVQRLIIFDL